MFTLTFAEPLLCPQLVFAEATDILILPDEPTVAEALALQPLVPVTVTV